MRKIILSLFFLAAIAISSYAQTTVYKPFRFGIGGGYAAAGGVGAKSGVLSYIEPSYAINDNVSFGLRLESAFIARGYLSTGYSSQNSDFNLTAILSPTVNTQYYFTTNTFRPFIGVGLGLFYFASTQVIDAGNDPDALLKEATKFGVYPRIGFDVSHFTFSIDFNIVGSSKVGKTNNEFNNNYIGVRLGGYFGGGKK